MGGRHGTVIFPLANLEVKGQGHYDLSQILAINQEFIH